MKILENLGSIRKITEKILPSGFSIVDIVYRDKDCGVFGYKGYSLIIKSSDNTIKGINWDKFPTKEQINRWIQIRIDAVGSSVQPLFARR